MARIEHESDGSGAGKRRESRRPRGMVSTRVLKKSAGTWKIVVLHETDRPERPPSG